MLTKLTTKHSTKITKTNIKLKQLVLKNDFAQVENAANFVNANSDLPYDSTWKSRKDVPAELETAIFDGNNSLDFVYGPYENNGYYNIAKVVAMENRSDSLMASHILVSYANALRSEATRTKEEAKALADSILNVVKKDSSKIETLAKSLSDDPSAQTNNGDLGWFTDGMMVHNFNEFVQDNKVGTVGMVETPFGYHIIKVTDRKAAEPKAGLSGCGNRFHLLRGLKGCNHRCRRSFWQRAGCSLLSG